MPGAEGLEIKRHHDGTRYVQPYLGTNSVTGKPLRPYHRFRDELTDEECMAEAERWLEENWPAAANKTRWQLGEVLARYISDREDQDYPANTISTYRQAARYAGPLAGKDVREITVRDLDDLYIGLRKRGGRGGTGLSPETVRQVHWFLRGAFKWMADLGLLGISPALSAHPPKVERAEVYALGDDEIDVALSAIEAALASDSEDDADVQRRVAAYAAHLGLFCGLRVGEVCALRMRDVYWDRELLHVGGTVIEKGGLRRQSFTKGKKPRNIAVTPHDLDIMRRQRSWRKRRTGRTAGADRALVSADGSIMRPSRVSLAVRELLADAGLPDDITFHTLRHTHATWLLAHGMDIKTVSERLGHADEATTLRIYAHVMAGRDAAAAELFAGVRKGDGQDG